jgi:hypothetical protein
MTHEERTQLFLTAWFETGQQHGYYLTDVPFRSLAGHYREHLEEEARQAAKGKLIPKRAANMWTFIEVDN